VERPDFQPTFIPEQRVAGTLNVRSTPSSAAVADLAAFPLRQETALDGP
jgi:hypothetical protein